MEILIKVTSLMVLGTLVLMGMVGLVMELAKHRKKDKNQG